MASTIIQTGKRVMSHVFYRLLTAALRDWELRRKRLNEMVEVRVV
ncbi:MAG: hypothetical protein PHO08_00080 [Methylococcales bacterium]|nr:hypothetical protein [Methylococcales bacterium]MDD5630542.1 hypothetical protein [Methylococcales bacterium]